ncbi:S41 family peptidase [Chitinophaga sp. Hz27]|uniref:S41 family peptidase n=1 Tax=Chitinophaga sp. Hz27 TaxID=3347169 RepID=UPI0035DC03E4
MRSYCTLLAAGLSLCISACRRDAPSAPVMPTGPVTQGEINSWISDSMHYFYLWNQQLPPKPDTGLAPLHFFSSLRNSADPFSSLYNPDDASTLQTSLYTNFGIDISIISFPASASGAIAVVKLAAANSYAASKFSRGSYITRINNTPITTANASQLVAQIMQDKTGLFTPATVANGIVTEAAAVQLDFGYPRDQSVYTTTLVSSNKKIGYLYYNSFNDNYNTDLVNIFRKYITTGITDLILDLRYNTGGSIAASALLSALITDGINEGSTYIQLTGNNIQGSYKMSFGETMAVPESGIPVKFADISSARLKLAKVYILTSHQTISAAELTINNLKPYTKVIQIGGTTYGKDKGTIIVRDKRNPKRISWVLQPITFQLSNASGQGGYTQGLVADYPIDEMSKQPLVALGDPGDPLIAKAISLITGNGRGATSESRVTTYFQAPVIVNEVVIPRKK